MIEYVALGDYEAAVGHLLASAPDKSARYYRDALCTLALAARAPPHAQWTHVGRPRHAVQALYSVAWYGDGPQGVFARRAEAGCIDVMHVPNVCVSCVCVCVCVYVCVGGTLARHSVLGMGRCRLTCSCQARHSGDRAQRRRRARRRRRPCRRARTSRCRARCTSRLLRWSPRTRPRSVMRCWRCRCCAPRVRPQRAFHPMSESLSTQCSRVTEADFNLCSTCKGGPARPPLVWGTAARARPCGAACSALPRGAALQEAAARRALRGCLARRGPPCAADAVPDDMPC